MFPEWLFPLIRDGVILALVGYIWFKHEEHDKERDRSIWNQIGRSSREGMREKVHDTAGLAHGHGLEISDLQRRVERIERCLNGALKRESER